MSKDANESLWSNARCGEDSPLLSVVVPYKDYDVVSLATELIAQADAYPTEIELLFADDGSTDPVYGARVRDCFESAKPACRLLSCAQNRGRSVIRNRLAAESRGRYLLYLDADMLPDDKDFIARYLELIRTESASVAFGGRSYRRVTRCPTPQLLYRFVSEATECVDADARSLHPFRYLLTNNLLVERCIVISRPFTESYSGWGFEDADWALRLRGVSAVHINNTASHMCLPSERELLSKYDDSVGNFLRIYREIPEFRRFALCRVSRLLACAPVPIAFMRLFARTLALSRRLPMRLRYLAVQGYRAATYAGVLRSDALSRLARRSYRAPN